MRGAWFMVTVLLLLVIVLPCSSQDDPLNKAKQLLSEGKIQEALVQARLAVKADPNSADARYILGIALMMTNSPDKGVLELEQAIQLDPKHFDAHRRLGLYRLERGDFAGAKKHFEVLVQLQPNNVAVRLEYGAALQLAGQPEAALEQFLRAKSISPDLPEVRRSLGIAYVIQQKWPEAEAELAPLVKVQGADNAELRYLLGLAAFNQGKVQEAREHFQLSLKYDPNHAMPHYFLGLISFWGDDLQGGEAHMREAMRIAPELPDPCLDLGKMYSETGRPKEAIELLEKARQLDPSDPEALFWIGKCKLIIGDSAGAKASLHAYLTAAPAGAWADEARAILESLK